MQAQDAIASPVPDTRARRRVPRWAVPVASATLLLCTVVGAALVYWSSLGADRTVAGLLLDDLSVGGVGPAELRATLSQYARQYGEATVTLHLPGKTLTFKRRELGARLDVERTAARLEAMGRTGHFVQDLSDRARARRGKLALRPAVQVDSEVALATLARVKDRVDRPPVEPKLDLERQRVVPGRKGRLLQVYDTLAAVELALRGGEKAIRAAVVVKRPARAGAYDGLDIGAVLGHWETVYSLKEKDRDRGYNLKVGASKLDGTIIGPGETFSFNKTVGPRTKAEGYRMAPVISEGELVDGMAGGACQLSSTLFAAAFFGGLDLVSSRPHTRPSSYIKMGLDAAVAYPTTDCVLKNPYDFPIVLHFRVNQGKVRVRILGKERPYSKVVFERVIKEVVPFKEETREDPTMPRGKSVVTQIGVPGYRLERRRLFYQAGKKDPVKSDSRDLYYPPTTKFTRVGTGPADPEWTPPKEKEPWGEAPQAFTLSQ